jgi:hypothetical protein
LGGRTRPDLINEALLYVDAVYNYYYISIKMLLVLFHYQNHFLLFFAPVIW